MACAGSRIIAIWSALIVVFPPIGGVVMIHDIAPSPSSSTTIVEPCKERATTCRILSSVGSGVTGQVGTGVMLTNFLVISGTQQGGVALCDENPVAAATVWGVAADSAPQKRWSTTARPHRSEGKTKVISNSKECNPVGVRNHAADDVHRHFCRRCPSHFSIRCASASAQPRGRRTRSGSCAKFFASSGRGLSNLLGTV
jgi:hypothetical protein